MTTIAEDIKDILADDVGAAYTVIRDAGDISGEYARTAMTSQATKPITLEHFRRCTLPYDSSAAAGDVIEFDVTEERFLVTNKLPKMLENTVTHYESILYKCNIANGVLMRPSGETRDDQYHKETQWQTIKSDCDAMQVAALYGNDLEADQELALIGLAKNEVYLPHSVGAQVLDRWQPASGEYYQVSVIESRRFPEIDILIVEEDHR
jgi:hypothetical protein